MTTCRKCGTELSGAHVCAVCGTPAPGQLEFVTEERADKVPVVIELAPSVERFNLQGGKDRQALEALVIQYVQGLMMDLALPGDLLLDLESLQDPKLPGKPSYQISVNHELCRLPLPTVVPQTASAKELFQSITKTIHHNRELFLTMPLAGEIRQRWSSETGKECLPALSIEEFHAFLSALLRRGYSLHRGKAVAQAIGDKYSGWTAENLSEQATAGLDTITIEIYLSQAYYDWMISSSEALMQETLEMMRDGLFYELGILLPKVDLLVASDLRDDEFRVQLNDLRLPPHAGLEREKLLVNDTPDRLVLLGLSGERAINPANGSECAWVRDEDGASQRCEEAGLTTWDSKGYLVLTLSSEIRKNAGLFLNNEIVAFNLAQLRQAFPALVEVVEKRTKLHELTRILRDLVEEELSIRDLRGLLEALIEIDSAADANQGIVFSTHTVNKMRLSQNRYISRKYSRDNTLVVIILGHEIETRLMEEQPIQAAERGQLLRAFFQELGDLPPTAQSPIVLTTIESRKRLKRLISKEFPQVAVVCYHDLSPDMNIQPIGRISWNG